MKDLYYVIQCDPIDESDLKKKRRIALEGREGYRNPADGKHHGSIVAELSGNLQGCMFYPQDFVSANIDFTVEFVDGIMKQEIKAIDINKV